MITLFNLGKERFLLSVQAVSDGGLNEVDVEVTDRAKNERLSFIRMNWEQAYRGLADDLEVNEHQVSAMAQGLNRGRTLKFYLKCRREKLQAAGFLQKPM